MANEIGITVGMTVNKKSADGLRILQDKSYSRGFKSDIKNPNAKGPVVASITVPLTGIEVDLSGLSIPGMCWMSHGGRADGIDVGSDPSIYYVEIGIKDRITNLFYPLPELWPGDGFPLRLSRNVKESYNSTGTGTGPQNNRLWLLAHYAPCLIDLEVFER